MNGLQLTADLYACTHASLLTDRSALATYCREAVAEAGLQAVGEEWFQFPDTPAGPGGVTGVVLLAESHVAIHTWPEQASVTLDIYVCNFSQDNSAAAETLIQRLIDLFAPARLARQQLIRGTPTAIAHMQRPESSG
ncbi:MAG: adenosylmethionine decarboxylase [Burkholderiales bacterium]|nr:adenosylmethionine decarboxylase [Burkholderiales bacterium]